MNHKRILGIVLFLGTAAFAQKAPQEIAEKLTLVRSAGAAGRLDEARLARVLWSLVSDQRLDVNQVPYIIVLHVPRETGMAVGIPSSGTARTDHCAATGKNYYQLWVLGEPKAADYVAGLETILRNEFGLQIGDPELKSLLARAVRQDLATVDAEPPSYK